MPLKRTPKQMSSLSSEYRDRATVAVLGAGPAGITITHELARQGVDVVCLEGSDGPGGRIRFIDDMAEGPGEIHGSGSILHKMAARSRVEVVPLRGGPTELDELPDITEQIKKLAKAKKRESVEDYCRRVGLTGRNEPGWLRYVRYDGEPPDRIGAKFQLGYAARSMRQLGELYADFDYAVDYRGIFLPMADELDICYGAMVKRIDWSDKTVRVEYEHQGSERLLRAQAVVSALPLAVLQNGTVKFTPKPPKYFGDLKKVMGSTTAAKVGFRFDEQIFPDGINYVSNIPSIARSLSGEPLLPEPTEYWMHDGNVYGWIAGNNARELLAMSENDALQLSLNGLERALGLRAGELPPPNTRRLLHRIKDPLTGHSAFPCALPGAPKNAYKLFARPFGNRVFFVGDYTHWNGETVHAAVKSAHRGSREVLARVA